MAPRILLVNPPVYDFSAYDFWLKPYGLLRVAGFLQGRADLKLFDYLDRRHATLKDSFPSDHWGRGEFPRQTNPTPGVLTPISRRYRRFGLERRLFQEFIQENGPFDFALVQTVMTYWYLGVKEVLEDLRRFSSGTRIVLGGVYATLCPAHACHLGADLVIEGARLEPMWQFLKIEPNLNGLPFWGGYGRLEVGILKLAYGCPFRCTYCSVPRVDPKFTAYPLDRSLGELELLCRLGARNIAFYDDALLYRPYQVLLPFLGGVLERGLTVNFHTPNALNARFITSELAELMVEAGFRSFFLGFESSAYEWQRRTGGKVYSVEFSRAVRNLIAAGASRDSITAYLIIGHPQSAHQQMEASMQFANDLGIRVMLSEFSPIPGTPDGEKCREWVDLDEPLCHNKTAFCIRFLGEDRVNHLKSWCREMNHALGRAGCVNAPVLRS